MKKTHKQIIYSFLKANEGQEFNHRQIIDSKPFGLGISEYSGRFSDLRNDFNCTCGIDQKACTAQEHIINTRKNYYKYIGVKKKEIVQAPQIVKIDVEAKLQQLRTEWIKHPEKRRIIEAQVATIQLASQAPQSFETEVVTALL